MNESNLALSEAFAKILNQNPLAELLKYEGIRVQPIDDPNSLVFIN